MARQIQLPDGTIHQFPDDATDQEISEALNAPPAGSRTPDQARTWMDTAKDVAIGFAKGAGDTAVGLGSLVHKIPGVTSAVDALYGTPGLSDNAFKVADQELTATNTPQMAGKGLEFLAETAIPITKGAQVVKGALPSTARAGAGFEQVMRHAHSMPVDVSRAGDVALRIQELADRGGSMPMVVRKFLRRVTDPNMGDLTYREARDFYHNISRLSANEYQRLTPVVQREVGALRVALNDALTKTAEAAGKGNDYRSAMAEYRNAARGREMVETVGSAAKKAAVTGTIGAAGYGLAKQLGLVE